MTTPLPLTGIGVVVTRPEQQAGPLCRLLEARGAQVERLPAITIIEHPHRRETLAALKSQPDFDLIIFTSANAVRFGEPLLAQRRDLTLAAIGPATARALNQAGYRVGIAPAAGFTSEHLLAHPRLKTLQGSRVLLVKGEGGRDLLQTELAARGAQVSIAAVYERRPAQPSPERLAHLQKAFDEGRIQFVTASSLEVAQQLLGVAPGPLRAHFLEASWVTPSARVSEALVAAGVRGRILTAPSADDQEVLAELLRWRAGESGA
jgi:uroporphyrinogen-III synthase